jgi:hypothetical protein
VANCFEDDNEKSGATKEVEFLDQLSDYRPPMVSPHCRGAKPQVA